MTTFAIFYELSDLASLAATINAAGLTNQLRQRGRPYWNGGLQDWATAPTAPNPLPNGDTSCPLCKICVIDAGNNNNLAMLRQLCYDIADHLQTVVGQEQESVLYLRALADDMAGSSGAVEPWPVV